MAFLKLVPSGGKLTPSNAKVPRDFTGDYFIAASRHFRFGFIDSASMRTHRAWNAAPSSVSANGAGVRFTRRTPSAPPTAPVCD